MTTRDPGARVVFTHGRVRMPRSTAFFASSAAPSITDGLEVLVHEVIAAMTTSPWSRIAGVSLMTTSTGSDGQPSWALAVSCSRESRRGGASRRWSEGVSDTGSLAGKESADASSTPPSAGS